MATVVTNRTVSADNRIAFRATWETYQLLAKVIGGQNVLLAYDGEKVELMSPGMDHEDFKILFSFMVPSIASVLGMTCKGIGSLRLDRPEALRGIEPDTTFYLGRDKIVAARRRPIKPPDYPIPDLAVEVDINRSKIDRPGIYATLGVAEVWRYDGETVRIDRLGPDRTYMDSPESLWFGIRADEISGLLATEPEEDDIEFMNRVREWAVNVLLPRLGRRA